MLRRPGRREAEEEEDVGPDLPAPNQRPQDDQRFGKAAGVDQPPRLGLAAANGFVGGGRRRRLVSYTLGRERKQQAGAGRECAEEEADPHHRPLIATLEGCRTIKARSRLIAFHNAQGFACMQKEGRHEGRPSEDAGLRTPFGLLLTAWRTPRRHAHPRSGR